MDYGAHFAGALARLKDEGRYRVFADIRRGAGPFPPPSTSPATAPAPSPCGAPTTTWAWASIRPCSPPCTRRSTRPAPARAARATSPAPRTITSSWSRACRPARQGSRAAVHLGLRRQRHHAGDAAEAAARLRHLLGREEPRLHDRRHPQRRRREAASGATTTWPTSKPSCTRCDARHAQDHRLRVRLFDGRPDGADRRDLRPGAEVRRAHLPRRGARGRPLRAARRRPRRARRRHAPRRHHQRHAGQGLRHHGRLHRRRAPTCATPSAPMRRASSSRRRWRRPSPRARSPASGTSRPAAPSASATRSARAR